MGSQAVDEWNTGGTGWNASANDPDENWGVGGNAAGTGGGAHEFGQIHAGQADDNWPQQGATGVATDGETTPIATEFSTMTCHRCNEVGHIARDCAKERDDSNMECRTCREIGHVAANCPSQTCRRCGQGGHKPENCTNRYQFPERQNMVPEDPDDIWSRVDAAAEAKDLEALRIGFHHYALSAPQVTWNHIEKAFRDGELPIYLIAVEKEALGANMTLVDIQGNCDKKYCVTIQFSPDCPRKRKKASWPKSPQDNIERLADAGQPYERYVTICARCKKVGHIAKNCDQEPNTEVTPKISCVYCGSEAHRARNCDVPRKVRKALTCRNCGEEGHKKEDCTNETNMDLVTCRGCSETGHFGKDCPKQTCNNCGEPGHMAKECTEPRSNKHMTCRNCDEVGHISKECKKKRDYSRVKCQNCGEMGHTKARCPHPAVDPEDEDNDNGGVYIGDLSAGGPTPAPAAEATNGADEWGTAAGGASGW